MDRHDEIIANLGELKGMTSGINSRLDRMNGSISDTIKGVNALSVELAEHPSMTCPMRLKVEEIGDAVNVLDQKLTTGDHPGSKFVNEALAKFNLMEAKEKALDDGKKSRTKDFLEWLKPFIIGTIMAIIVLLAIHFNEIWGKHP